MKHTRIIQCQIRSRGQEQTWSNEFSVLKMQIPLLILTIGSTFVLTTCMKFGQITKIFISELTFDPRSKVKC